MIGRLIGTCVVLALLAAAGYGAALFGRTMSAAPQTTSVATRELSGRVVIPMDAGLSTFQLPSLSENRLVNPERAASVTSAVWTPGGGEITYGYFYRKPGDNATSAEIFVIPADGGQPTILVERDVPGAQVDFPSWTADGKTLYFSILKQEGARFVTSVEKLERATGVRTPVAEGYAPWVSPDGRLVTFLRDSRLGQELWIMSTDGGEPRQLVPGGRFTAISSPRFTPDSKSIVLAGANPVGSAGGSAMVGGLLVQFGRGLIDMPTAYAHGDPFDVWSVSTDGGEPSKLAVSGEDEPALAWSPDGQDLLMYAPGGIYQFTASGGQGRKISDRGGYGGIDWVR
jgi:Tol biopolymer transport system component